MNRRSCKSFQSRARRARRGGVTLIEVVLGLVILGTIVASIAVARGRAMRQYAAAELQLRAARVADALISTWLDGPPQAIPLRDSGPLADLPGCVWRTRALPPDPQSEQLSVIIVRYEISD